MSHPKRMSPGIAHGHHHAEAYCRMLYRCACSTAEEAERERRLALMTVRCSPAKTRAEWARPTRGCGAEEWIWNSRDGVTPFVIDCLACGGEAQHDDWYRDDYQRFYVPHPGERLFRDGTLDEARAIMRRRLEAGRGTDFEVPEAEWPAFIERCVQPETMEMPDGTRVASGEFAAGWPMLDVIPTPSPEPRDG